MSNLIGFARTFAIAAHSAIGQKRKGTETPYWVHPKEVAELTATVTDRQSYIASAWLHDVLEDTQSTKRDLASAWLAYFEEDSFAASEIAVVMQVVDKLTDMYKDTEGVNRLWRVSAEIVRHKRCEMEGFWVVKMCDILSNLRTIEQLDPNFLGVYLAETYILALSIPVGIQFTPVYRELFKEFYRLNETLKFMDGERRVNYSKTIELIEKKFPKTFTKEQLRDYFTKQLS